MTSFTRREYVGALLAGSALAAFGGAAAAQTRRPVYTPAPDIVVAQDGSGDFTSVQAALQSIPTSNTERKVVLVRNGTYTEMVRIDAPYVTLRGESRSGVRIAFDTLEGRGTTAVPAPPAGSPRPNPEIGNAVLNIAATAHDFVAESLTIHNTYTVTGPHAFAVMGRADRTVIQDADIYSLGADTLSLWRTTKTKEEAGRSEGPGATPLTEEGGRYYHARIRVAGSVDFVCPRGWCYMTDSTVLAVNHFAEAAIWHSGTLPEHKFVIRQSQFDGPPGYFLGRKHRDAAFYLIDCTFSDRTRDKPIYRVIYPLNGGAPTQADIANNQRLDKENLLGDRAYYFGARRPAGIYPWMRDNLGRAQGSPKASDITAKWTFGGTWDPERAAPRVVAVKTVGDEIELTFSELVTVKGAPRLAMRTGAPAAYRSGSGTNALRFAKAAGAPAALDFSGGVIIASEAAAVQQVAGTSLATGEVPARKRSR